MLFDCCSTQIQILEGSVSQKLAEERAASEASASASPASNAAVASASAPASVIVPHTTAIGTWLDLLPSKNDPEHQTLLCHCASYSCTQ